jgi:hypothetical protein
MQPFPSRLRERNEDKVYIVDPINSGSLPDHDSRTKDSQHPNTRPTLPHEAAAKSCQLNSSNYRWLWDQTRRRPRQSQDISPSSHIASASGSSSTMPSAAELQRESIEESLGLEEIDPLTYRSTRLWIPINARYVKAPDRAPIPWY